MAVTPLTRLGSNNAYDNSVRTLGARQNKLVNLQENLTTGKKVVRPSDDPTGAAQAERAQVRISRIATDQRALENQKNSIAMAESTLGDITSALQRFRELTVAAGSGSASPAERRTLAIEMQQLREQVLSYANRKDTNGLPLFGALGSAENPFSGPNQPPQDYLFLGLPGQPSSTERSIPNTVDGDNALMLQPKRDGAYNVKLSDIPPERALRTEPVKVVDPSLVNGSGYTVKIDKLTTLDDGSTEVEYTLTEGPPVNGFTKAGLKASYPPGIPPSITISEMPGLSLTLRGKMEAGDTVAIDPSPSVFSVMDDAVNDIGDAVNDNAAAQAVALALYNLDKSIERVSAVRGQTGALLNRADRISSNQEARNVQLEADRSRAEDLDMIKGVAEFQNQQTGYQAALQSYAQTQKLSLFNYLS
ncbi:flagellar hook-associated protein FlgL [Curvibacter sp. CHRR-16]|uniref:flagellar hook-associated protein FlgL n=1 Tax=Curvibacter sp. CHRR-16 TaxID=2835872 RepID=UPI001BDAB315|nr:flagellar hook-associated protein FlgL [Curvibacter sp. CHRR-16]MBT0569555.1 flagellar hook-associated protein FlgL [Curvibacter sp. CHRR-16]